MDCVAEKTVWHGVSNIEQETLLYHVKLTFIMSHILTGGNTTYGFRLGVLMLNTRFPRIVGDVGNALTYRFPVVFKIVKTANLKNVAIKTDYTLLDDFISAAKELESSGVKAITTSCGFLMPFQEDISRNLGIPFFSSSLMLIPLIQKFVSGKIGIVTANSRNLTSKHLKAAGLNESYPVVVKGLEDTEEFSRVILDDSPDGDFDKINEEVRTAVDELLKNEPDVKAILFECHNLPPYADTIRSEFGIPVFDYLSLVNMVTSQMSDTVM